MAYQSALSVPRFYCNVPEWLAVTGAVPLPSVLGDNPTWYEPTGLQIKQLTLPVKMSVRYDMTYKLEGMQGVGGAPPPDNAFVAILGHDMGTDNPGQSGGVEYGYSHVIFVKM